MRTILTTAAALALMVGSAQAADAKFESNSEHFARLRGEAELFLALGERQAAWAHACKIPSFRETDAKTSKNCPAK